MTYVQSINQSITCLHVLIFHCKTQLAAYAGPRCLPMPEPGACLCKIQVLAYAFLHSRPPLEFSGSQNSPRGPWGPFRAHWALGTHYGPLDPWGPFGPFGPFGPIGPFGPFGFFGPIGPYLGPIGVVCVGLDSPGRSSQH